MHSKNACNACRYFQPDWSCSWFVDRSRNFSSLRTEPIRYSPGRRDLEFKKQGFLANSKTKCSEVNHSAVCRHVPCLELVKLSARKDKDGSSGSITVHWQNALVRFPQQPDKRRSKRLWHADVKRYTCTASLQDSSLLSFQVGFCFHIRYKVLLQSDFMGFIIPASWYKGNSPFLAGTVGAKRVAVFVIPMVIAERGLSRDQR